MSFRPGLLPSLLRAVPNARAAPSRAFHFLPEAGARVQSRTASRVMAEARAVSRAAPRPDARSNTLLYSLGLGLTGYMLYPKSVHCDAMPEPLPMGAVPAQSAPPGKTRPAGVPEEAKSMLNVGELSFGAACGICAGVFVKKGFKIVAFALGGVYVLLQYLSSKSYVKVDWGKISNSYDGIAGTVDANGNIVNPTVAGLYTSFVDFLTADFQQRATFVAGFLLGLRVG